MFLVWVLCDNHLDLMDFICILIIQTSLSQLSRLE